MDPSSIFHPSRYLLRRNVFAYSAIDYAQGLNYVLGSAFCALWHYCDIGDSLALDNAAQLLDRAVEMGLVEGNEELACKLQEELDACDVPATWDQGVLVKIARGGLQGILEAQSAIRSRMVPFL